MLILSNEEIEQVLTMERCIEALETLFAEMADGRALGSPRADIFAPTDRQDRYYAFKSMAGVSPTSGVAALRLNSDVLSWPVISGVRRRVKVPAAPGDRCATALSFWAV